MRRKSSVWVCAGVAGCFGLVGCTGDFANLLASFGGVVAGRRGEVQVLVINNTSFRAVFTLGTYNQTDPASVPDFSQFSHDADGLVLEGDESSPIGVFDCARVFGIGGSRLIDLIERNVDESDVLPEALIDGVEFFSVSEADGEPISQGRAAPFEALLGVDFPCNALLILRLEVDDAGPDPFRVDFELIPSESTR